MSNIKVEADFVPPTKAEWEAMFPKEIDKRTAIVEGLRIRAAEWLKAAYLTTKDYPIHFDDKEAVTKHNLYAFHVGLYSGLSIHLGHNLEESDAEIKKMIGEL